MNLAAAAQALIDAGASMEMVMALIRADQAEKDAKDAERRAKAAERQRRSRMSRNVTVTVRDTSDVTVTPPAPPKTKSAPTPPEKTQPPLTPQISDANASSTGSATPTPAVRQADVDLIWNDAPRASRHRSSKADTAKALRSAAQRGYRPEEIRPALANYFASEQATRDDWIACKGLHRIIECDRWKDWVDSAEVLAFPSRPPPDPEKLERYLAQLEMEQNLA